MKFDNRHIPRLHILFNLRCAYRSKPRDWKYINYLKKQLDFIEKKSVKTPKQTLKEEGTIRYFYNLRKQAVK